MTFFFAPVSPNGIIVRRGVRSGRFLFVGTDSYETSEKYFLDLKGVSSAISWNFFNQMLITYGHMCRLLCACMHFLRLQTPFRTV